VSRINEGERKKSTGDSRRSVRRQYSPRRSSGHEKGQLGKGLTVKTRDGQRNSGSVNWKSKGERSKSGERQRSEAINSFKHSELKKKLRQKKRMEGDQRMLCLSALNRRPLGISQDRSQFEQKIRDITAKDFSIKSCGAVTVTQLITRFAEFDEYDIFEERVMLKRQWKRIMDYGFQRKKVVNALKADLFSGPDELINALQQEKAAEEQRNRNALAQNQSRNVELTSINANSSVAWGSQAQQAQQWGVLPAGWDAKRDPRNGRIYYMNHHTKQTTYNQPLPPGWTGKTTFDQRTGQQRMYFINHSTKQTSWEDPRKPIRI